MEEIFKDIEGYDGIYQISNLGRVRSFKWKKTRYLKPGINNYGYYYINLSKNNIKKAGYIHMLVWDYFGDLKRNGMILQVDHIDGNKSNNRLDNLQLLSCRENITKHRLTTNKTSKYTGVGWYKRNECWTSQISINGKSHYLGRFDTELEAHTAYKNALSEIKNNNIKL